MYPINVVMKRIIIFASGSGTNAENIIKFFNRTKIARVTNVLCNNKNAKVFDRCKNLDTKCLYINKNDFSTTDVVLNLLKNRSRLYNFSWLFMANSSENCGGFSKENH